MISNKTVNQYGQLIDTIADKARDYVTAIIQYGIGYEGLSSVSDIRNYAIKSLEQTLSIFGDQEASLSANIYDTLMSEYGLNLEAGQAYNMEYNKQQLESSMHYHAQKLVDGDLNGFLKNIGQKAYDLSRYTANQTMIKNAERDYKKGVRWARVPSGKETCGFCVMLASRGFDYKTKESAGYTGLSWNRFHRFCDCRVVPGTVDTQVEGYNPDHLYSVYRNARATVYGDVYRKWSTAYGFTTFDSLSDWLTQATIKEIETRSVQWVYQNEPGKITKDKFANVKPKEDKVARILASNGFNVHFIEPSTVEGRHTADALINSQTWEIKQPIGNTELRTIGKNTIDHQFDEASKQSRRIILDLTVVNEYHLSESPKNKALALFFGKWSSSFDEMLLMGDNSIERYKQENG